MTIKTFLSAFVFFAIASCNNHRTQEASTQETPKALEDNSASYELISKRGYNDLIESLYDELLISNPDLKDLENKITELNQSESDSTRLFNKYNQKNLSYFNSADKHVSIIKDSLLRKKIITLIANDSIKYNASIARHKELLKTIDSTNLTVSDLHTVLKIVKTLPLIEKYQKENLPSTQPLEGYMKQQDKVIKLADTLLKKKD